MKKTLCIIGLERELAETILQHFIGRVIIHDTVPKYVVNNEILYIESDSGKSFTKIDIVVFHGIFENDFDIITALAFWGGPCFPNAFGMMNCRLKAPCLARALTTTKFGAARGMLGKETVINASTNTVAKWGNWHCGDNKEKILGRWKSNEASILEPFFNGQAVRIIIIGDQHLQIKMDGDNWLKSIHHDGAKLMGVDEELLIDSLNLKKYFGLQMIANDYIFSKEGKYLLEVNHIPNVTRFEELKKIYFEEVMKWLTLDI